MILVLGLAVGMTAPAAAQTPPAASPPAGHFVPDFPMPDKVDLCGVTLPLADRDVYERLDYELVLAAHGEAQVLLWLRRLPRYAPHIRKRLADEGLPADLLYQAIAESDLLPRATSPARAAGIWQFIPGTGKLFGLSINRHMDERRHFERSTEAAITYMKKLHGEFGDWLLAMAAYNCGEGCVREAIREQGVRNYFRLDLPYETERYVYRIAAIKVVLENPRNYGFQFSPDRAYQPIPVDRVAVGLRQDVHISQAARAAGTDYKAIKELNPELTGDYLPAGSYQIFVPKGLGHKMAVFLKSSSRQPPPSPSTTGGGRQDTYTVKRGDTLSGIAEKTGVSAATIQKLNGIKGSTIHPGQKLRLN